MKQEYEYNQNWTADNVLSKDVIYKNTGYTK